MATAVSGEAVGSRVTPWVQLILGIICMASIANYQYGWTLFVLPMGGEHT